jgi:hypothetical protein
VCPAWAGSSTGVTMQRTVDASETTSATTTDWVPRAVEVVTEGVEHARHALCAHALRGWHLGVFLLLCLVVLHVRRRRVMAARRRGWSAVGKRE